jgi:hypothetical protein
MVYAGDVIMFGGSVNTIQEKKRLWLIKKIGLEVNSDKSNYMVISRDQTGRRSQSMGTDNRTFETEIYFHCLVTTLRNQHSIQEEI